MMARKFLTLLAVVAFGAGLGVSPALAKCSKDCKTSITTDFKACKTACASLTDKAAKKACKKACVLTKNSRKKRCKTAVAPACSPSGAFVDASLD